MRLPKVERQHRLPQKLMLAVLRLIIGLRPPDVLRTVLYRPEFFGKPFTGWMQAVMRGPSEWSIGQRELFAAFTSRLNQCRYCIGDHGASSSQALHDNALVEAVLKDWRSAPLDPRTRAMLGLLEKLTLDPAGFTARDVVEARATGLSDGAIEQAVHVCAIFNILNRLADGLGFQVPSPQDFVRHGQILLRFGYKF
jgi:uncharacterized peroxidase-related enzyme